MAGRYTDEQIEAAVQALSEPGRFDEAQRIVAAQAPQVQRILNQALDDADWFGPAHQAEVRKATDIADPGERALAVRTLIAEETRVVMLIGVAAGFALAQQLNEPKREDDK